MVAGLGALCLTGVLAFAGTAGAAAGDPAGNNGTIKIDGVTLDDAPNNEPHPGCSFEVDFYGFDQGDILNATVTFAVHNPTGDDVLEVDNDVVFIGDDANDGGGSEAGLDASERYDLYQGLTDGGYEPGRMGYHIKLTVHADGSIGADTKHKVFWVTDCVPPVDEEVVVVDEDDDGKIVVVVDDDDDLVVDDGGDDTPVIDSVVITEPNTESDVSPSVGAVQIEAPAVRADPAAPEVSGAGDAPAEDTLVLGKTVLRPQTSAAPGGLARTGSAVAPSVVLAAILLMLGTLARRFGRVQRLTQP